MLYSYSSTAQTVNSGSNVIFNVNGVKNCCCIEHTAGTSTITIKNPGVYVISFNTDVTSATTGSLSFGLYNNGNAVNGASASTTLATADNTVNMDFTAAIKILPSCPAIDNTAQLTIVNTGDVAASISNAAITVRKV